MITAHLVLARNAGGTIVSLYAGSDQASAEKAFKGAGAEFLEVQIYHHPAATNARYPFEEQKAAEERATRSEREQAAAIEAMRAKATENRARAKQLEAEAKKLHGQAEQAEKALKES